MYGLVYMLVGEGQAQQWIKTAEWENSERYQDYNHETIPLACYIIGIGKSLTSSGRSEGFPKSAEWNKIPACSQKSDEAVHDYYDCLQIVFN